QEHSSSCSAGRSLASSAVGCRYRCSRVRSERSHSHFAVHRHGSSLMLTSLLWTYVLQQLGKMGMTIRGERTHTKLVGQCEGLSVIAFRLSDIAWVAARRDLTEQTHAPGLVATLFLAPRQAQALVSLA